jgi:hypothetical protein
MHIPQLFIKKYFCWQLDSQGSWFLSHEQASIQLAYARHSPPGAEVEPPGWL